MPDPVIFSPSILSADFTRLGEEVRTVEAAGADWIHIDVMDGHFVPNITMGPVILRAVRAATDLPIDVHLMVENPERYISDFAEAGANLLTVQIEACRHIHRIIEQIHSAGCRAGVALNPGTPPETLSEIFPYLDLVLVMSVDPGFSGQKYIPATDQKIARTRELLDQAGSRAVIEVDGGVDTETLPGAYRSGARAFVAASAVYKHPAGAAQGMKELISSVPQNGE